MARPAWCSGCDDDEACEVCKPVEHVPCPHEVIYLQYDPEACDEATWCQDRIDEKDTVYRRDDVVKGIAAALLLAHSGECKFCPHNRADCGGLKCGRSELGYGCYCAACVSARGVCCVE